MRIQDAFDRTLFFLGAGASIDAGCRSSKQMLLDLDKRISLFGDTNKEARYRDIYKFILAALSFKNTFENPHRQLNVNIEDFVMVLRQLANRDFIIPGPIVGSWNERISRWEYSEPEVFTNYISFIRKILIEEWVQHDIRASRKLLSPWIELLQEPDVTAIDLFSLNYDLVFESTLNTGTKIVVNNGFSKGAWIDFNKKDGMPCEEDSKVDIYKLHGSLDWVYDPNTESVKHERMETMDYSSEAKPFIIFGTDSKMISFDPFLSLLSSFKEKLREKSLYVIIGYSFFDRYINNLIIQQLAANPNKKMLVVNPAFSRDKTKAAEENFLDTLFEIQRSKQNTLGFTKVSPEKVELRSQSAKDFYRAFLGKGAKELLQTVEKIDTEEKPF